MKIRDLEQRRMKTFSARVKLPNQATVITAQVVAANYELARRLLIGQYGAGTLVSAVNEVK
jgi:hypothetical protein